MRVIFAFLLLSLNIAGQDTLTFEEFQEIIISNHPLMKQAELLDRVSVAQKIEAKSLLDPYLSAGFERKNFDDKLYYENREVKFIVPTKFGLNFEADFQENEGEFLNNRELLPESGLITAGVSIALIRGLLFDERRQALRNAEILIDMNENQKRLMINELLSDASEAYVKWQISFEKLKLSRDGFDLALAREEMIIQSFLAGDMAAVDTLEASVNRQNREQKWNQFRLEFEQQKIILSSFLWDKEQNLGFIENGVYPESLDLNFLAERINQEEVNLEEVVLNHPKIENQDYKIDQLELKRRLAKENQKPKLDLKVKPHSSRLNNNEFYDFNTDDYSLGLDFELPIFNRAYRAESKLIGIEIENQEMQIESDKVNLRNHFARMQLSEELMIEQLYLLRSNNEALERLLQAEQTKFIIGESSLFVVNSRESKYLESREKELEMRQKFFENRIDFFFNSFLE